MNALSEKDLSHSIEQLNAIGIALSTVQNHDQLLEMILLGAKGLTNADGGSLYILKNRTLNFVLVHTTSLELHMGGTSKHPIEFSHLHLDNHDGQPNLKMVVTRAVNEDRAVNIPDAYQDTEYDLSGTKAFDAQTGYHSQSLLAIPMKDHEGTIIGALQLINATAPETGKVRPFSATDVSLVSSLSSQAAIALNRRNLIEGLKDLLNSLVKLIATAIDDKSPHTGGHCRRVPSITMALAQAVNIDNSPLFGLYIFTSDQMKELEMAAWLHDCGKITTPEYVVNKHSRLEAIFDRVNLIDARLEILSRDHQMPSALTATQDDLPESLDLQEIRDFIHRCNSGGTFIDDAAQRKLDELAKITVHYNHLNKSEPLLTENELYNLSIQRGTLTDEERDTINSHVDSSIRMLEALPFPKYLQKVPEIAGGHHERMDGTGYPRGVPAGQLSVQARILAIADIFEALTASDRTYRQPNTLSEALTIMARMCHDRHIDSDLMELFIREQVYNDYTAEFLLSEQIDTVDAEQIIAIFREGKPASFDG